MDQIMSTMIDTALEAKLSVIYREQADLRQTLNTTLEALKDELLQAANERTKHAEYMTSTATQLKNVYMELQGAVEERNALKAKLQETEMKLQFKLGGVESQLQTIGSNVDVPKETRSSIQPEAMTPLYDPDHSASPPLSCDSDSCSSVNPSSSATQPREPDTPVSPSILHQETGPSRERSPARVNKPSGRHEPGVIIDTRRRANRTTFYTEASEEYRQIRVWIDAVPATRAARTFGIERKANIIKIHTETEEDAEILRQDGHWITNNPQFIGMRARGDDWHPIKVDSVIRNLVLVPDTHNIKPEFADEFCAENGFSGVVKAYWISKGVKRSGSMVIHMAGAEDAARAKRDGVVEIGGTTAVVREYHRTQTPQRCPRCNRYGHGRARCTGGVACGKCAGPHETEQCISPVRKCAACGGPHTVRAPDCPVYLGEKEKLKRGH